MAENIGELISNARKQSGMTLHTLAEKARVREKLISDIESNNFPHGHIPTYTRSHIMLLAKELGISKEELDSTLAGYQPVQERPMQDLLAENNVTAFAGQRNKIKLSYPVLGFFAVLVILGMVLIPSLTHHSSVKIKSVTINSPSDSQSSTTSSNSTNASSTNNSSSNSTNSSASQGNGDSQNGGSTSTPATSTATTPATSGSTNSGTSITTSIPSGPFADNSTITSTGARIVSLSITGTASKSWISVTSSAGQVLYQGVIMNGHQSTFSDGKSLQVQIGNAAGVDLNLNGKELGAPGAAGAVLHLTFLSDLNGN